MKPEELFLLCIGRREMLRWYIDNNINLPDYVEKKYPAYVALAKTLSSLDPNLKNEAMEISVDKLLMCFKEKRKDLYDEIYSNPRGMSWLKDQIILFKEKFI